MAIDVIVSNGQDTITTYQEAIRTAGEKLVEKGILMLSILTLVLKEKLTSRQDCY